MGGYRLYLIPYNGPPGRIGTLKCVSFRCVYAEIVPGVGGPWKHSEAISIFASVCDSGTDSLTLIRGQMGPMKHQCISCPSTWLYHAWVDALT